MIGGVYELLFFVDFTVLSPPKHRNTHGVTVGCARSFVVIENKIPGMTNANIFV